MQALRRLTLLDIGLIAALIVTGVLWYLSANRGGGSLEDVDFPAWDLAMENLNTALLNGSLQSAKSAIEAAAEIATPAGDGAAEGIRTFANAFTEVTWTGADRAFGVVDGLAYQSPLFEQFYLVHLLALFFPAFPVGQPEPGAEWTQANLILPNEPTLQYWGTATWTLPEGIAESAGEADIEIPDVGFTGKLMLADDGEAMQLSLVFLGQMAELNIVDVLGFWTGDSTEQFVLSGGIVNAGPGTVVMALDPAARDEDINQLRDAVEIGITLYFENGQRLIMRFELGDTGRSVLEAGLP